MSLQLLLLQKSKQAGTTSALMARPLNVSALLKGTKLAGDGAGRRLHSKAGAF